MCTTCTDRTAKQQYVVSKTAQIEVVARLRGSHPVLPSVVHKNLLSLFDVLQGHHKRHFLERKLSEGHVIQR